MSEAEPVLLVLGSGAQQFREYLLESAASRHRLWLFDPDPPTWQARHLAGNTVLDVFDPAAAVSAARELAARRPILGVYCYHEAVILAAAHVSACLGLPGPSVAAVEAVRDKHRFRQLCAAAGLASPRFALVESLAQAYDALDLVGLPLVAKPTGLGASQGVVKVERREDLAAALEVSRSAVQRGMHTGTAVLLEEYLPGPEISIDAAVHEGEYLPLYLARKKVGPEPYFEEVGHLVTGAGEVLADGALTRLLVGAHQAVGWRDGSTHSEVKLTPHGPVIVEINGRLGGDLIPYLGQLATGIDPNGPAIDLSLGKRPDVQPARGDTVGIRFLYPDLDQVVDEVTLPSLADIDGLCEAVPLASPGTPLRLPPRGYVSRYGYLVARATSAAACEAALDAAGSRSRCSGAPLTDA